MTSSPKFLPPSKIRKLRSNDQVAAVCYRSRSSDVEFLLVRTSGGRWTFPKGSSEAGLTHAQAAALEAFEEAGVHGHMCEACFTHYVLGGARTSGERAVIKAYLCEVLRQVPPEESDRKPTWFASKDAKRKLGNGRSAREAKEFSRVIDEAIARISGSVTKTGMTASVNEKRDALQVVAFEAAELRPPMFEQAVSHRYGGGLQAKLWQSRQAELWVNAYCQRVLQLDLNVQRQPPNLTSRPQKRLPAGDLPQTLASVIEIGKPASPQIKTGISTKKTNRNRLTID